MVFSSIPPYLDPSSHWHHHLHQNQQLSASTGTNPLNQPPLPPAVTHGGGAAGSIRPGSMAERARMANIPMPEAALKCPRCESTNTKFCYFNNYSLSQPRHFCKTCRRYWTRGGALRNVPVGGGCRRNKKSKSSSSSTSSKSPGDRQAANANSTTPISTNIGTAGNLLGLTPPPPPPLQFPPLRFMSPLNHLTDNFGGEIELNYSGITAPIVGTNEMNFHGSGGFLSGGGAGALFSGGGSNIEAWRLQQIQQFPFLTGILDPSAPPSSGMYQFNEFGGEASNNNNNNNDEIRAKGLNSMTQMASVKIEENPELRQLGGGNEQWNTTTNAAWTDLSSFSSSSTSNPNL